MRKLPCIFEVQSRFPFPADMLRYDACYPVDATSSAAINNSIDQNHSLPANEYYTVRLRADHLPHGPTEARWASFLWKVVDVVDDI